MKIRSFPIGLMILVLLSASLTGCGVQPASPTLTPLSTQTNTPEISTQTPPPTSTPTESPLSPEMEKLFKKLEAKQGTDEKGNPIYFVTNKIGENVTVGVKNKEGKWELGDATKYTLSANKEDAQNNVFDYGFVMRGGPGQIAKLNAEPFPEDVITGLNVIVVTPNYTNYEIQPFNYLYYDRNAKNIISKNPNKEPNRNMGWFSFVNEDGQQGIGTVWQWINPDSSIIYLTTIDSASIDPGLEQTPFVILNLTVKAPFTTANPIGTDSNLNKLIQQWADTDIIPVELQYHPLLSYSTFNP